MSVEGRGRHAQAWEGRVLVEAEVELRHVLLSVVARMVLTTERLYLLRASNVWSAPIAELRLTRDGRRFVARHGRTRRVFLVAPSVVGDLVVAADSMGLKVGASTSPTKPTTF
ncbi:MAG: hypothetical protein H6722_13840 [Sandaracinus sp.]|nr:hypothetical protein [Sandaracinus sp.]MCB9619713.1 hypothetical protein [Sandaracinus sp.]MCB9624037.1 hypothetical protein [Sandaracinus sp.]MCB9625508.1 hypothetical protein [Sandaracinus sp.]